MKNLFKTSSKYNYSFIFQLENSEHIPDQEIQKPKTSNNTFDLKLDDIDQYKGIGNSVSIASFEQENDESNEDYGKRMYRRLNYLIQSTISNLDKQKNDLPSEYKDIDPNVPKNIKTVNSFAKNPDAKDNMEQTEKKILQIPNGTITVEINTVHYKEDKKPTYYGRIILEKNMNDGKKIKITVLPDGDIYMDQDTPIRTERGMHTKNEDERYYPEEMTSEQLNEYKNIVNATASEVMDSEKISTHELKLYAANTKHLIEVKMAEDKLKKDMDEIFPDEDSNKEENK